MFYEGRMLQPIRIYNYVVDGQKVCAMCLVKKSHADEFTPRLSRCRECQNIMQRRLKAAGVTRGPERAAIVAEVTEERRRENNTATDANDKSEGELER